MRAPSRRRFGRGLALALGAPLFAPIVRAAGMGGGWGLVPTVTILSAAGDPRLPLVRDAIAFWDRTLAALGSSFRFGAATEIAGTIPAAELASLSLTRAPMPASVRAVPGNIVVALSEGEFVSFCLAWFAQDKALVAIKSQHSPPLTLPNVARNVVAHELGHSLGLGHDSDPAMLMCGRPAPCRPGLFASAAEHYFPLNDDEKRLLLSLYPADWHGR